MRIRFLIAALAAIGVSAGTVWCQVSPQQTAPKAPGTPPTGPRPAFPAEPPAVKTPVKPVVPATGTPGTTTVVTPVSVPPELAKLEAEAALEVPAPQVPAGRSPEAKRVAEAAVKVRRATWVVEKLLPPLPEGVTTLSFTGLKVGSRGWIDTTGEVIATHEGLLVVRPSGAAADAASIAIAGDGTATVKSVNLRGEYTVDRTVVVDGRDVMVLKEVAAAKALDAAAAKLITAARARLEEAKAEHANAVAVLAAAKKKAVDAVMERATAEAAKQITVPDNATGEDRIKAKAEQDRLAEKLAKAELDKIAEMYGDVPTGTPVRK